MLADAALRRVLGIALLTLVGCGGGAASNPEPGTDPTPVQMEPEPGPVAEELDPVPEEAVAEPEPEPEPTALDRARVAVTEGRYGEASRAYTTALAESEPGSSERAEALINLGLLQLVVPDEPDLEGARERLEQAQAIASGAIRLGVASMIKLLDEIDTRDETVRRLTRLIGSPYFELPGR